MSSVQSDPITANSEPTHRVKLDLSVEDRIERWYLSHIRKVDDDNVFIVLAVCVFLYEKYLRVTGSMAPNSKFSKSNPVFTKIASDFSTSKDAAYNFWHSIRNGVLHRGFPKISDINIELSFGFPFAVTEINGTLQINPQKIADIVRDCVKDPSIWKDQDYETPNIYE